jgi:acetyl-CoA acetyltransferase
MAGASGLPKAAIVGVGQTEFSKNSGRSELQLAAEAVKAAIDDAGLTPADIDGLVTFTQDENDELDVRDTHRPGGCRARRSAGAGRRPRCNRPPRR